MARIRSIKPDAFRSDTLCQVPRGVRWTFAGLWTYLDDDGYGRDNVLLIKAALYPLDEDISIDTIADDLNQLEAIGSICRYEVDGKAYLHIPKSPDRGWDHQKINRPTPTKFPLCHEHSLSTHAAISEPSPPDREQGREQGREDAAPDLFPEFWATYPRKTDKGNAKKAWLKALKKKPAADIIAAAAAYAATKPEPRFTAHPTTWLNGERWDDEIAKPRVDAPSRHPPLQVPDHIDPDNPTQYAEWMRSNTG